MPTTEAPRQGTRLRGMLSAAFPGAGRRPPGLDHADDGTPMSSALRELEGTLESLADEVDRFAGLVHRTQRSTPLVDQHRAQLRGAVVVFSGTGLAPAPERLVLAEELGFTLQRRVTEATDLVVVASLATATGQVERARALGVSLILERDFRSRLGLS